MEERKKLWPFLALFAYYVCLSAVLPAVDDEVYYWCWSKDVQWSYYDHPPLTAVLIRLSTMLLGDNVVGFRLPACLASTFTLYVINRLTPNRLFVWALLLTPLFAIFAVIVTPDSPLILFWSAYLWWLVELQRRLTPIADGLSTSTQDANETSATVDQNVLAPVSLSWWVVGGILLGCGVLSKYTMGLAVPAGFASLLCARRRWKDWMPGYVLHGVIAFGVASPILIYNIQQDFEPLLFQWRHVAEKTPSSLRSFGDFIGVQVLAFGTIPFVLFPWVCFHFGQLCRNPRLRVCTCLYALPLAFFLYKSTQSRLEANWAIICFISFWPIVSEWYESVRNSKAWRWATLAAFLPPTLAVIGITVHLIHPVSIVPLPADRVYRQVAMNSATREIATRIHERGDSLVVFADTYQLTALLRFQSLNVQQVAGLTRPSHFTRPPRHLGDVEQAYVVMEQPLPAAFCEGFSPPELVATVPVVYRGRTDKVLKIWLYSKTAGSDETGRKS